MSERHDGRGVAPGRRVRALVLAPLLAAAAASSGCAGQGGAGTPPGPDESSVSRERPAERSGSAAPAASLDASWVLLPAHDRSGGALALDSVQVLAETRLRALGVRRIERARRTVRDLGGRPGGDDGALERARAAGHRYAVLVGVEEWRDGRVPGEVPRVAIELVVHDLLAVPPGDERSVVLHGRGARTARGGEGPTATADRALAAALAPLAEALVRATREPVPASGPRTEPGERAATHAAVEDALSATMAVASVDGPSAASEAPTPAPVAFGVRLPGTGGAGRADGSPRGSAARVARGADAAAAARLEGRATAFFYAAAPPIAALAQFDRVVLEPENVGDDELERLAARGAAPFAYLSVGEVGAERAWAGRVDPDWTLGRNAVWGGAVADLASAGWRALLDERVDALVEAGYVGLFLDTMDSYLLHATTPEARERQASALGDFIVETRRRHPSLRLIANRGFEVLERVAPHLEALAAESLHARWDHANARYVEVPQADREWLLDRLEGARAAHGVDLIAIDYLPPERRDEARAVAARIAARDIVPWVATPGLDHVGVGTIDVVPREVLLPYDGRLGGGQSEAEVHRLLATPLEYLGYVPVYHDLASEGLPPTNLAGRYAGVAYWNRGGEPVPGLHGWLETQAAAGVPLALFGAPSIEPGSALAARAGLAVDVTLDADTTRVRERDASIGFERPPPPRFPALGTLPRSTSATNTVHLALEDGAGRVADAVVTGPWGGLAAGSAAIDIDLDGVAYWIVDPYAFLRRALGLVDAPMPDVTSEGGARLWLAHIDGDALPSWAELPGRRLGAELVRERILERYPLPHTISVVEAEMTALPAHADRRPRMFRLMREIFAMPNVEIASHTFSHPYRWAELAAHGRSGRHNLPVAGYVYSAEREVGGSAAFIDAELAPPHKRTRVMLWSGDALPGADALAAAETAGLANMNGGFTAITRAAPALSLVTPMARTVGPYLQVYAPIMNENVYTNDWSGPFDGFRRVTETFELTDRPRRLKPINIYYHFYAGTKAATLRSLEEVYAHSLRGPVHPVSVSDYAHRVRVFREAGLARRLDGSWRLHGLDGLRSLRVTGAGWRLGRAASDGVAAAHRLHDGLYLDTDGGDTAHVALERAVELGSAESR